MEVVSWKNAEGLRIHAVDYPIRNPKAVIALVHGQGEHFGRYDHLAKWYNKHQVAVFGFDQQGYGQSEGVRGHARNLEVLLDDICQFLEKTAERYPGVPIFLYGHSMGGAEVLTYVLRRDPVLAGLISTSPLIRLAFATPRMKVFAGKIMRRFMPSLTLPTGLAAHFISHDPAVVKAYQNDKLVHGNVSAAEGIALLEMSQWLDQFSGVFSIPVLLMHGSDDKITSAAATKSFFGRVAGEIEYKEWPGLWHETHNEPEKEQIFEHTLNWMFKVGLKGQS